MQTFDINVIFCYHSIMKTFNVAKITSAIKYSTEEKKWISAKRSHHILAYQVSGFFFHYFENSTLLVKPDTFFFINQKDFYRVEGRLQGGEALCVHFICDEDLDIPSFGVNCNENSTVKNDFLKLLNAWAENPEENRFYCLSLLYKLLHSLKNFTEKSYVPLKSKRIAEHIAATIESGYQGKVDFALLSEEIGFSTRYINKIFHETYGATPNMYLLNFRLLKAMELLTATKLPIEKIAVETGFSDAYYFSKFFKKQTGVSPSRFRKQSH